MTLQSEVCQKLLTDTVSADKFCLWLQVYKDLSSVRADTTTAGFGMLDLLEHVRKGTGPWG